LMDLKFWMRRNLMAFSMAKGFAQKYGQKRRASTPCA